MKTITHEQLWDFAQSISFTEPPNYRSAALDAVGLLLHHSPQRNEKDFSWLFAGTGGNFVTYNYLSTSDTNLESAPIVMNVPTAIPATKAVMGENLYDFLCLGCEIGYFYLDLYVRNSKDFFDLYEHPYDTWKILQAEAEEAGDSCDYEKELLQHLVTRFALTPWNNIQTRLHDLQKFLRD